MLDKIRLATPAEIEPIAATSDLTPRSVVYAFDNKKTGVPDLAVVRQVCEIDPLLMQPDSGMQRRVVFTWGLETLLRANGIGEYYCNILADSKNEEWRKLVEKWGMERISSAEEYRYKRLL